MTHCTNCLTFSGRFQKSSRCCQIRMLMESPKHTRIATYEAIRKSDGYAKADEIKQAVRAEYTRKLEFENKESGK